ncbi:MAG: hypothetical protein ACJ738_10870 [Gaiellales bacterium]
MGEPAVTEAGAARAMAAILRHAAAEREGLVSVRADGDELVVASPGETSLLVARLPLSGDGLDGSYAPPNGDPPKDAGTVSLSAARAGLAVQLGRRRLTLRRMAEGPVEVEWVWPATAAAVEAVVSRDRLLEALPAGEGRIVFVGADRQLLLQAGRDEQRVPLKNRTRRRKDIGTAVSFDELRRLVEAAGADVTIELADLRPLTIVSGTVRGVVVRGMPMRWHGRAAVANTAQPQPPPSATAAPKRRDVAAERAAERAARKREAERMAAARARDVKQAQRALGRAVAQLDAASEALAKLDDAELSANADQLRAALRDLLARCGDPT